MLSFTTDDRMATAIDGTSEKVKWSAACAGTQKQTVSEGRLWHYDDGNLVYFDGKDVVIEFHYEEMN